MNAEKITGNTGNVIDFTEEIKKCKTQDDLFGENGLIKRFIKEAMENMLQAEMEDHLGRRRHERSEGDDPNYRNGVRQKPLPSSAGEIEIDVPRDRKGQFKPVVVENYQNTCGEFDKKIISMYAKGMTVRDIQAQIKDIYGIEISPSFVSSVTDKVMSSITDWQNRMLDRVYPIIYMDAVHFKVRDDGRIVNRAAYVCLGLSKEGRKDILGIWVGEHEGAKFWLSVCNELRARGVQDVLLACVDGLVGLPDAIRTAFPEVDIQTCIVHQIRNSIKYIASKDQKEFMKDLKPVYKATSESAAFQNLGLLESKWGKKYDVVIKSWYNNWDHLSTFFKYPPEIRKIIYTTYTDIKTMPIFSETPVFMRTLRKISA